MGHNTVSGQHNTSSPYSMFGVGELSQNSFGRSTAMGQTCLGMRSPVLMNITNPASYSAFDSLSFIFEFGLKSKMVQFVSQNSSYTANDINVHYMSLGFPVTKWWSAALGIVPFSDMGYDINLEGFDNNLGDYDTRYYGVGGLNKFFIGSSFDFFESLSVGVNASYLYGEMTKSNSLVFRGDSLATFQAYNYQEELSSSVGDFHFRYGLQYYRNISDYSIVVGGVFENSTNLRSKNSVLAGTVHKTGMDFYNISESNIIDTLQDTEATGSLSLPMSYGIGASLGKENKFRVAVDFNYQNWKNANGAFYSDSLENSYSISAGAEIIPKYDAIAGYWKRMNYRFGTYYNKSYLYINGYQLNDYGISFGVGFPIRQYTSYNTINSKSSLNFSVQAGQRGTTDKNLIKENYIIFTINLSLHDKWFVKRKFD